MQNTCPASIAAISIFEDKEGAVKLALHLVSSYRSKNVDARHHHIRRWGMGGSVEVPNVVYDEHHGDSLPEPKQVSLFVGYDKGALMDRGSNVVE